MQIIPVIDIKNGKCVRLFQGDYDKETIYSSNPIEIALKWKNQGAKMIHIVDLDGAKSGKPENIQIIQEIIKETKIPIQVGGGIRNLVSIYRYIEADIFKIILGTIALENKKFLETVINKFKSKMIVSLDSKNGILMKKGWLRKSSWNLIPTIKQLEEVGVNTIIYTDTTVDGTLTQPNYNVIENIRKNTKLKLIIAGGISSIEQIEKLKKMKVDGVIIGKALYEGKINLKEVIKYVG